MGDVDRGGREPTMQAPRMEPRSFASRFDSGSSVRNALGRAVPATSSVTGFEGSPLAAPSDLTSVQIDYQGLGRGAAAHLTALIAGEPAPRFTPGLPELRVRGSTGPAG